MARLFDHFGAFFAFGLALDATPQQQPPSLSCLDAQLQALALLERCRDAARAAGASRAAIESASFAATAWFDERTRRRPDWRPDLVPLQSRLYNSNNAHSEFFHHLSMLEARDAEVREVFWHALALGFKGQYYFEDDDRGELGRLKDLHGRQLPVRPLDLDDPPPAWTGSPSARAGLDPGQDTESRLADMDRAGRARLAAWPARASIVPWLVALVLAVLTLLALPWLRSPGAIRTMAIAAGAAAALAAAWHGWRLLARRHGQTARSQDVRAALSGDGRVGGQPDTALVRTLRRTLQRAIRRIARARRGRRLARDAPRMLFVGGEPPDLPNWLRACGARTLTGNDRSGADAVVWRWHHWSGLIGIELPESRVQAPRPASPDLLRSEMFATLAAQDEEPLAGVVACLPAGTLLHRPADADRAQALRGTLAAAARALPPGPPVHLLITSLDALPGYGVLRAALPAALRAHALGQWRGDAAPRPDLPVAGSAVELEAAFDAILQVLQSLRLGLHRRGATDAEHLAALDFCDRFAALRPGLVALHAQCLDSTNPAGGIAWASLHVCADALPGPGDFVPELFERVLPELGRATAHAQRPSRDRQAAAPATSLRAGFGVPRRWP
ncbi:MAG: hypothetical protein EOO24_04665 [Comamonadaceae bacterium]|nr:MAG: hypothetical protein EOO24_04665 [Comamonadaceae bacterium]